MKSLRFAPLLLLLLSASAFADSAAQSFQKLKTLAGTWEGTVTTTPPAKEIEGQTMHVTFRVTSMGNVLMHEMTSKERPDDPITMFYLDNDRLLLTHYCDAGNRPRMEGKLGTDGKTVNFELVDVAGPMKYGHMHGSVITLGDEDHHAEDWTFMLPGDKSVRAHVDLKRVK